MPMDFAFARAAPDPVRPGLVVGVDELGSDGCTRLDMPRRQGGSGAPAAAGHPRGPYTRCSRGRAGGPRDRFMCACDQSNAPPWCQQQLAAAAAPPGGCTRVHASRGSLSAAYG